MTVQSLTLSTDKRQYLFVTPLVFRSGEKNVTVDITVVDSNNKPYDLTDKDIYFEEQKQLHYVSDNEKSSFDLTNAKNGQFIYTLNNVSLLTSGEAWFRIQSSDQSTIDTTQTFNITILDGLNLDDDKSYISALSLAIDQANGLLEDLKSITDGADGRLDTFFMGQVSKITTWKNETLNGLTATVTQNKSDVAADLDQFKLDQQNKLTDLTSQWDSLKADITKSVADADTATAQATSTIKDAQNLLETIPNDPKYIGPQGVKGDGLKIDGSADSVDTLPTDSTIGTTYLVDGSIYTYNGAKWNDCGKLQGPAGTDGIDGKDGAMGPAGVEGKSAYQVWLDNGNTGTESDYLTSLKGKDGIDGKDGTNGINGVDGQDGDSAYQVWLDAGNTGTEAEFLESLKGKDGSDGADGAVGPAGVADIKMLSAYKIADDPEGYFHNVEVNAIKINKIVYLNVIAEYFNLGKGTAFLGPIPAEFAPKKEVTFNTTYAKYGLGADETLFLSRDFVLGVDGNIKPTVIGGYAWDFKVSLVYEGV